MDNHPSGLCIESDGRFVLDQVGYKPADNINGILYRCPVQIVKIMLDKRGIYV